MHENQTNVSVSEGKMLCYQTYISINDILLYIYVYIYIGTATLYTLQMSINVIFRRV